MPFMTRHLSKKSYENVAGTQQILKSDNEENRKLYTKQRNYCVTLLRKAKKAYYENLDKRNVSDNKPFWKTVNPSLSEKFNARERISFSENGETVKTEMEELGF